MSKPEKLKEKAKGLEARDPRGAIEAWLEILKAQEAEGDPNPDLSVFNRIGDLYLKVKDPAQAADYYDQAVDRYAEAGLHNNAIAMCNKVLRNAPGRQTAYLKLAKLYAAKGFMAEAKQNFVAYAERMQKSGKIQQAFAALKEFTDISPQSAHLRVMLEEHLEMYGEQERRPPSPPPPPGRTTPTPVTPGGAAREPPKGGAGGKSSSLVFLDLDEPPASKPRPGTQAAVPAAAPPEPPTPPSPASSRRPEAEPKAESLIEPPTAEPDTSLAIEPTTLAEGVEPTTESGMLEGFETTSADVGSIRLEGADVAPVRDELTAEDLGPVSELEPTVPADAESTELEVELEPLLDDEIEIEQPVPTKSRTSAPQVGRPPQAPTPPRPGVGSPPRVTVGGKPASPVVQPSPPAARQGKLKVEVPPLELEPDFDTPLPTEDIPPTGGFIQTEDDTSVSPTGKSAFVDLGVNGAESPARHSGSLVFADIDAPPATPTIEELEARVAENLDDPEAHQALGEALIEAGERERGIEELDHATTGFETRGNLPQAQELVDEILRLDPNSVRHRQKQVEFAFKSGDKGKLIEAYLELADTLLRQDLPDKARAVYQRVAEHDPKNERARAALAMLAPVVAPPEATPGVKEGRTAPKDAKMKVRDQAAEAGEFVDLGAMILEDEAVARDTRMKVADEEPTGDEEKDFQEMLARFKQGVDENIDEADFQSHYDLGVAFKEMGLLDEAIAEFQKALPAPEGKLKSSEALGVCFIEKHAYVVAESILRRGLELPAAGDQERLGILYWLGRALEEQGKKAEARELYGRVFAVDIRFKDVGERTRALSKVK